MRILLLLAMMITATAFSDYIALAETDNNKGMICENKYVLCTCDVNEGKNFGMSECQTRTPVTDSNGVTRAVSNYSFNQTPVKPGLLCPSGKPWTFCLDKPCIIDPWNPVKAICTCDIERKEPFVTFGGECNTLTCDTAYWSAATLEDIKGANVVLMKAFGLKDDPIEYCPGVNP